MLMTRKYTYLRKNRVQIRSETSLGLGSADHYYLMLGGILSWLRAFGPRTTRPGGQLVLGPHVRGDIIWSGRHVVLLQRNRIPSSHPPSSTTRTKTGVLEDLETWERMLGAYPSGTVLLFAFLDFVFVV